MTMVATGQIVYRRAHVLTNKRGNAPMFGNRLGWGISAVIVAVAGYLVVLVVQAGRATPPSGWVGQVVRPMTLPAAAAVLPGMTDPADAGDLYRQAIGDAQAHPEEYANLAKLQDRDMAAEAARPGLRDLLQATPRASMDLFRSNPELVVTYDPDKPPLVALTAVADGAKRIALIATATDPATATKYYASLCSLGVKLANERVVFDELSLGEDLMGTGAAGMQSIAEHAHDDPRVRAIKAFDDQRLADYQAKVAPVWTVVSSLGDTLNAQHAGDMFQMAQEPSAELMWRVEATLKLGRMRFNADRRGDQVNAVRVLKQMAADASQPVAVQTAAAAARDLTIEQYRQLR